MKRIGRWRMTREHRWTAGHIHDYLDDDLAPDERGRVERHVGVCPECRRALVGLQRVLQGLMALRSPAPAGLAPGIVRRLRSEATR
jgi:anti-sigma factor RsiW